MSRRRPSFRLLFPLLAALCCASWVAPAIAGVEENQIRTLTQTYGPYDLEAGGLMQMHHEKMYAVDEPFYVVSYETIILNDAGEKMPDNFHCHTTLRTQVEREWWSWSQANKTIDTVPFRGLYSDGHTTHLEMPEGFGIFFGEGEGLRMMPMFNNRSDEALEASMVANLEYVALSEMKQPLRPLYSTSVNVIYPHLYWVEPGIDEKEVTFQFTYPGKIHLMAVHVHPYGQTVEIINETKGKSVWKAVGNRRPDGTLIDMPVYDNVEGYDFTPDEKYRLRVTYENPTDREQDAMGGIFIFFSTEDDESPHPAVSGDAPATDDDHSGHAGHGHEGHQR